MNDLPLNQIIQGDCIEVLQGFPENSVDLVVTDPPYGLNFMGKEWDKALPPKEAFVEMFRVLKPGGLAFVMSSPRQDLVWRMCALLEESGFELSQSFISWIYKTGFPKAYDVSKGIDKRPNRIQKTPFKEYCNIKRNKMGLTLNQINIKGGWATTGGGVASEIMGNKIDNIIPSVETYNKLKIILNLDDRFDLLVEEAEREVIKSRQKLNAFSSSNGYGVGFNDYEKISLETTKAATDLSEKWDGWKAQTGLKPAVEPVIWARKPFASYRPMFLLTANLLISLSKDEVDWLKLIALTVDKSSILDPQSSSEDGENSVPSTARMNTSIKRFNVDSVEKYLQWSNHPNSNSVPITVPQPIIQALTTRLGREVGSSEATAISQYMSELENTDSNMILLWKNTLIALLLKMSNATIKTTFAMTTELKILNSLLCQDTSLSITRLKEIIQNGLTFDALTVVNCFQSVFSHLNNIPFITVQENATTKTEKQNLYVDNVEINSLSSTSTLILESIAHGIVTIKPVPESMMVLMVNKPFSESSIVDNVLRWGTGAINIDACRIPLQNEKLPLGSGDRTSCNKGQSYNPGWKGNEGNKTPEMGRFPANLIVSDDALDDGEITKSGDLLPHHNLSKDEDGVKPANVYGKYQRTPENFRGDEGGKSRYFDLDAWAKHRGFLDVAKPSSSERDFGLKNKRTEVHRAGHGNKETDDVTERFRTLARNIHPTVKPIKLMAYLIELGCPKNGVVLDPFVGSGTTCIAAKRLCRRYIGIELSEEYHALAVSRVAAYPQPLEWFGETSRDNQTKLVNE